MRFVLLCLMAGSSYGQSALPLKAGKVFVDRIDIASNKKIRLPDGRWVVMGLHTRETPLTGGTRTSQTVEHVSLMNENENAPLQYLSISWTTFANVNWTAQPCDSYDSVKNRPIKDTLNTNTSSITVKCSASIYDSKFSTLNNFSSTVPVTKDLWQPIAEHRRVKPENILDVFGYISKNRSDYVQWNLYINPKFYGLDQASDTRYKAPANEREIVANNLLKYAADWNKLYIQEVEKDFFPGLFQSASASVERFNFQERVEAIKVATTNQIPTQSIVNAQPIASLTQSQLLECRLEYKHNCRAIHNIANGEKYVGEYKDDKRNGQGTYTFNNGNEYVGEWRDDERNGQGTFTFADGEKYVGQWKDGQPNGLGTYTFLTGHKFDGNFKDGQPNGVATFLNFSGTKHWVQSFSRDTQRSPANPFLPAAAIQAAAPDPIKAERDRLAADLEASRKKQQELEEQLRVSQATSAPNTRPALSVPTERRVALVIGNAAYKVNPLKNPVNDSNDMARSLRAVGFDVIEANNTTLVAMREATRRFADKLVNSDVGLVYYSGHGVEVKGKNYLIPVNADIKREYEVVDQAFDASQFLEMMDSIRGPNNKRVNILLVDACRNNELQRSWRSTSSGLGRMDAPGGTFISFATAPGRVAADGLGRNSPYTKHLLQALKQPNMPIEQVFKVVRRNVMDETKGEQIPWDNSSLVGDFFFTVQK
jgi:hypothetical protein